MQLPIVLEKVAGESLQLQIVNQIRALIHDGRLAPGARLPASRALARDLGVSRNTVAGAYARLVADALLEAREPIGTFVAQHVLAERPASETLSVGLRDRRSPVTRPRVHFRGHAHVVMAPHEPHLQFDFWVGRPDARFFPMRAWRTLLMRMLQDSSGRLCSYGDPQGLPALREAIAAHVGATRGIATSADRILVTNGIQEGLNLLSWLLIKRGVNVAIENPCYRGAAHVFASHGAALQPVAVDQDGIDTAQLPKSAAVVYVTPSHQYPLGMVMPLQRRRELLAWAAARSCYIAEDDYDNDFFYDGAPLPALKCLDTYDQVIYLGTFSKSLGAGLRLGYMILPADLCEPARHAKALLNNCQPWLEQAALAAFIAEGGYAEHLRRLRHSYAARCKHLRAGLAFCFADWVADGACAGMHLIVRLPPGGPSALEVEAKARAHAVGVYAVENGNAAVFGSSTERALRNVLLLGYAALSEAETSNALLRLRHAVGADQEVKKAAPAYSAAMRRAAAVAHGENTSASASMAPSSDK